MNNDNFADYDLIDIKRRRVAESALLADAWSILRKNILLFSCSLLACLSIGYMHIRTTPRSYLRSATVIIKSGKNGGMLESQRFNEMISVSFNSVENEVGIFKSKRLMYLVAERLQLNISYRSLEMKKLELYNHSPIKVHFLNEMAEGEYSFTVKIINENNIQLSDFSNETGNEKSIKAQINSAVETPIGKIRIDLNDTISKQMINGRIIRVIKSPLNSVANSFSSRLKVDATGGQSSLITLSIIDENSTRAEDILNTLINIYNEDTIEDKNRVTNNTGEFINERLLLIDKELNLVDSEIEKYKRENQLTDLQSVSDLFLHKSGNLDSEGLSVENQLNMTEYIKDYLNRNNRSADMIPASVGIQDNGIQQQISDYNELIAKRNKLLANSSENNPLIKDMELTLKSHRRAILRAIDNLETSLKVQKINMENKERETLDRLTNIPLQQKEIVSIERQQKVKEELYLYLLNKKEENELQQTIAESNCKVVDAANGSSSPVSPNKVQIIIIAIILGFGLPALWIYLRSIIDTKVYTLEDIKERVNIPILGDLPFDKEHESKDIMFKSNDKHDHLSEAFRIIRENLNFIFLQNKVDAKVIQVISLNPGSGKTFVTINLGICIATSEQRVLVIDLDLRKGELTKRLEISRKLPGVSNYLSNNTITEEELIHTINTPLTTFDMIPSGILPPNPAELLKSKRLEKLISSLKEKYDYILFDNPPYGLVVDAFICSRLVDQSIYIIRSGLFDKRLLPDIQELYDSEKMKHLTLLLNCVDYNKINYNYKYNYSYSYNYSKERKKGKSIVSLIRGIQKEEDKKES